MMGQQSLYRLSEIVEEMKPVRTLQSLRSALGRRRGIFPSTIPADHHQVRELSHPSGRSVCLPIG